VVVAFFPLPSAMFFFSKHFFDMMGEGREDNENDFLGIPDWRGTWITNANHHYSTRTPFCRKPFPKICPIRSATWRSFFGRIGKKLRSSFDWLVWRFTTGTRSVASLLKTWVLRFSFFTPISLPRGGGKNNDLFFFGLKTQAWVTKRKGETEAKGKKKYMPLSCKRIKYMLR